MTKFFAVCTHPDHETWKYFKYGRLLCKHLREFYETDIALWEDREKYEEIERTKGNQT